MCWSIEVYELLTIPRVHDNNKIGTGSRDDIVENAGFWLIQWCLSVFLIRAVKICRREVSVEVNAIRIPSRPRSPTIWVRIFENSKCHGWSQSRCQKLSWKRRCRMRSLRFIAMNPTYKENLPRTLSEGDNSDWPPLYRRSRDLPHLTRFKSRILRRR